MLGFKGHHFSGKKTMEAPTLKRGGFRLASRTSDAVVEELVALHGLQIRPDAICCKPSHSGYPP
jgi:hypothetical protein